MLAAHLEASEVPRLAQPIELRATGNDVALCEPRERLICVEPLILEDA
jgi:hypothetical protein